MMALEWWRVVSILVHITRACNELMLRMQSVNKLTGAKKRPAALFLCVTQ
jgi:hypothetical protein